MMEPGRGRPGRGLSNGGQSAPKRAQNVQNGTIHGRERSTPMLRRREFGRIRSALARSTHFQELEAGDLDRLAELGRLQRLRHREHAARSGERDDQLWIILTGAVRVSTQTPG